MSCLMMPCKIFLVVNSWDIWPKHDSQNELQHPTWLYIFLAGVFFPILPIPTIEITRHWWPSLTSCTQRDYILLQVDDILNLTMRRWLTQLQKLFDCMTCFLSHILDAIHFECWQGCQGFSIELLQHPYRDLEHCFQFLKTDAHLLVKCLFCKDSTLRR